MITLIQLSKSCLILAGLLFMVCLSNCGRTPPPPLPPVSPAPVEPDSKAPPEIVDKKPLPELEVTIEPSVIWPGESALLRWKTKNADRVLIDHNIGVVEGSGKIKFFPDRTTTYKVTAQGVGGEVVKVAKVEVRESSVRRNVLGEDLRPLSERFNYFVKSVFFNYDSADLTEDAKLILDENSRWLNSRGYVDVRFLIEGHSDERGTEEYNLALGDRRAQSVLVYLTKQDVVPFRMKAVSYGEERPFNSGQSEAAWTLNRRADFVLLKTNGAAKTR